MIPLHLFPTTIVGSWPRPTWLMEAFRAFERGEISRSYLNEYMADAVKLAVKEQELAGVDILSDGEQRRYSFLAVIGEHVEGFRLMSIHQLARGRTGATALIEEMMLPKAVVQPIVVSTLNKRSRIAVDELKFVKKITKKPIKVPLPSPYMLAWQAWDSRYSKDAYPSPEDLTIDLTRILRREVVALRDAGASFVQFDDPTIHNPLDPQKYMKLLSILLGHKPKSMKEELSWAVELVNESVRGVSGLTLGFHVCRGNWPAPCERLQKGGYKVLLPYLVELKVDQLVLEFATPRAGSIDVLGEYSVEKQIGLGVIDVKDSRVESIQRVTARVKRALKHLAPEQIYLNPDCGFASGRGWPVMNRQAALQKLSVMVKAAEQVRFQYR